MTATALLVALSLSTLNPASHAGLLLGQEDLPPPPPPPPSTPDPVVPPNAPRLVPANEREVTIRALREEIAELSDQKSGIGFVFPILCIGVGVGGIVLGTVVRTGTDWLNTALLVAGTTIAALSTLWFILRLVKSISLGNQISDKEEQLRRLEAQRPRALTARF